MSERELNEIYLLFICWNVKKPLPKIGVSVDKKKSKEKVLKTRWFWVLPGNTLSFYQLPSCTHAMSCTVASVEKESNALHAHFDLGNKTKCAAHIKKGRQIQLLPCTQLFSQMYLCCSFPWMYSSPLTPHVLNDA